MSIYSTDAWQSNYDYVVNDVVISELTYAGEASDYYFYCLKDHHSTSADISSDYNNGNWGGIVANQSVVYPHFLWVPSYGLTVRQEPKVKTVKFGDGYEQRVPDGINTSLLMIDYSFDNRKLSEATAILHFLFQRAAHEPFMYTPLAPYDTQKLFVCRTWEHNQVFVDNFSIKARFEEVPA